MFEALWKPVSAIWSIVLKYHWVSIVIFGVLTAAAAYYGYGWATLILGCMCGTVFMQVSEEGMPPAAS
ncbi:hypothetical protein [Muricoccus radiodurans]|uniref:hypothetical protein n=1 Tax=Muricoccus radiodurans TaxID=2231721 RepID=UPI003CEFF49A